MMLLQELVECQKPSDEVASLHLGMVSKAREIIASDVEIHSCVINRANGPILTALFASIICITEVFEEMIVNS